MSPSFISTELTKAYTYGARKIWIFNVGDIKPAEKEISFVMDLAWNLNRWTDYYHKELLGGKWDNFFNWQPTHWFRSTKMDAPVCTEKLLEEIRKSPKPGYIKVEEALSREGALITSEVEGDIPLWIHALTPTHKASKKPKDNEFCTVDVNGSLFLASAKPINNIWHSPLIGPMWSKVGTIHLKKGENRINVRLIKSNANIDDIFVGVYPPFPAAAKSIIKAEEGITVRNSSEGEIHTVKGLGFNDGVVVLPFDTPSYEPGKAPALSFVINIPEGATYLEIRTLSNLHVYEGRDARYAVAIDRKAPEVFSIHAGDFTAEWRWNVLRGYARRTVDISSFSRGKHKLTFSFLDQGIVLQELRIY